MSRPDFRQAYRTEALDLLGDIEETLLALEEHPEDLEACHRIFRAMHTIKGNGAMFGFTRIANFAHHIETALDAVRNGELPVTQELIDIVLAAQDHLKMLLDGGGDERELEAAGASLVERIVALQGRSAAPSEAEETASTEASATSGVIVHLSPDKDFFAGGQDPLRLIEDVHALGPCGVTVDAEAVPPWDDLDPESCHLSWRLVVDGEVQQDALRDIFLFVDEAVRFETCEGSATQDPTPQAPTAVAAEEQSGVLQGAGLLAPLAEAAVCLAQLEEGAKKARREPLLRRGCEVLGEVRTAAEERSWSGFAELCQELVVGLSRWLARGSTREGDLETFRDSVALLQRALTNKPAELSISEELRQRLAGKGPREDKPRAEGGGQTLRVQVEKVDQLLDLVGEVALVHAELAHRRAAGRDSEDVDQAAHRLDVLLRQLQDTAMTLRMIPIEGSFQRMKRLVRDLSKSLDKPVDFQVSGGDTEIDRSIAEKINDPLVHLLRNCMDHGLEAPETREAAGKSARGRIELSASQAGGEIQISIRDDGGGLDLDRILARARERGLCRNDADPDPQTIAGYIFEPGFSTAQNVTSLSGRGVGMDVVRTNIEAMRGRISTATRPGLGTRFTLHIPLTLAILDAMVLRVGETLFAVPIETVLEIVQPRQEQLLYSCAENQELLQLRDQPLPVLRLRRFFGLEGADAPLGEQPVLAMECDGQPVALTMDELLGQQQVVTKPLTGALTHMRAAAGCGLLGSGDVAVVLDTRQLAQGDRLPPRFG